MQRVGQGSEVLSPNPLHKSGTEPLLEGVRLHETCMSRLNPATVVLRRVAYAQDTDLKGGRDGCNSGSYCGLALGVCAGKSVGMPAVPKAMGCRHGHMLPLLPATA
jgi:hypothetical protein